MFKLVIVSVLLWVLAVLSMQVVVVALIRTEITGPEIEQLQE